MNKGKNNIGLKRGVVKLVPHNNSWKKLFEKERKNLKNILGKDAVEIEHIGSTAIPRISAKPVIDVLVGLSSMKNTNKYVKILEKFGYFYRPKFGHKRQHLTFAKGNESSRTHYIHLVKHRGVIWKRDLGFRNYLQTHPSRAKQYDELKKKLEKKFPNDRRNYTKSKSEFILETNSMATKNLRP
jgi:GrpB-like predicted nucleotidyltransferase (UPF0157 family)